MNGLWIEYTLLSNESQCHYNIIGIHEKRIETKFEIIYVPIEHMSDIQYHIDRVTLHQYERRNTQTYEQGYEQGINDAWDLARELPSLKREDLGFIFKELYFTYYDDKDALKIIQDFKVNVETIERLKELHFIKQYEKDKHQKIKDKQNNEKAMYEFYKMYYLFGTNFYDTPDEYNIEEKRTTLLLANRYANQQINERRKRFS